MTPDDSCKNEIHHSLQMGIDGKCGYPNLRAHEGRKSEPWQGKHQVPRGHPILNLDRACCRAHLWCGL